MVGVGFAAAVSPECRGEAVGALGLALEASEELVPDAFAESKSRELFLDIQG
jgi:hypothetical protein